MGESSIDRFPFHYNRSLEVDCSDESVSADAGALLMRQTLECSGVVSWLEDRRPGSVVHSMGNRMCTCRLLLCQGHRDQDDADRLRQDPALVRQRSPREALSAAMEAMACRPSRRYRALWIG